MLLSGIEKEFSILGGGDLVVGRIEIAFAAKIESASIPCTSQLGGEGIHTGRQALGVVTQQNLCNGLPPNEPMLCNVRPR